MLASTDAVVRGVHAGATNIGGAVQSAFAATMLMVALSRHCSSPGTGTVAPLVFTHWHWQRPARAPTGSAPLHTPLSGAQLALVLQVCMVPEQKPVQPELAGCASIAAHVAAHVAAHSALLAHAPMLPSPLA